MGERLVYLNVGGVVFVTRRSTVEQTAFFEAALRCRADDCDELFVDRDPTFFRYILNWMRGVTQLPEDDAVLQELAWEADYYGLVPMSNAIIRTKSRFSLLRTLHGVHSEMKTLSKK